MKVTFESKKCTFEVTVTVFNTYTNMEFSFLSKKKKTFANFQLSQQAGFQALPLKQVLIMPNLENGIIKLPHQQLINTASQTSERIRPLLF